MRNLIQKIACTAFLGGCMASGTVRTEPAGPPPPPPPREHDHRGPAEPPPPPPRGPERGPEMRDRIIEGFVFDAQTHEPLAGAAIDVASPATRGGTITVNTDGQGRFRTEPLPPDELHVRCRFNHYVTDSRVLHLQPGVTKLECGLRRER